MVIGSLRCRLSGSLVCFGLGYERGESNRRVVNVHELIDAHENCVLYAMDAERLAEFGMERLESWQ